MRKTGIIICGLIMLALVGGASAEEQDAIGQTPPRLSFVEGQVSFWRPGAKDWVQAQVNTALAPGDQLFAGPDGNYELQIGGQAFVRGGTDTQIGFESQEPDFMRFKVTSGYAAFDLRRVEPGRMVEVSAPNAAFTMDTEGYYRVDVGDERTSFTTRRTGRAIATTERGETIPIGPNESLVFEGTTNPVVNSQPAPPTDSWDAWNYGRTDQFLEAESTQYVSPDAYGVSDLDHHGTWRTVPTYGAVWMPRGVAPGWAPYTTGSWMSDPRYGWTWVDTAPWGWAPYHYGRWVHLNGYWCWAPGPRVVRPVYAPALVAFFGAPGVQVSLSLGGPAVGWVSLGWGEPLVPWWGRPSFRRRPYWGGWGGPRFVNNREIRRNTIVNINHINVYQNTRIHSGMVVVRQNHFGRGPVLSGRIPHMDNKRLRPMHGAPQIAPGPDSFVPHSKPGRRPPEDHFKRAVITSHRRNAGPKDIPGSRPNADSDRKQRSSSRIAPTQEPRTPGADRSDMRPDQSNSRHPKDAPRVLEPKDQPRNPEQRSQVKPFGNSKAPEDRQRPAQVGQPRIASPRAPQPPVMGPKTRSQDVEPASKMPLSQTRKTPENRQRQPDAGQPRIESPRAPQPPMTPRKQEVRNLERKSATPPAVNHQKEVKPQRPVQDIAPARSSVRQAQPVQSAPPRNSLQPRPSESVQRISPNRAEPKPAQGVANPEAEKQKRRPGEEALPEQNSNRRNFQSR